MRSCHLPKPQSFQQSLGINLRHQTGTLTVPRRRQAVGDPGRVVLHEGQRTQRSGGELGTVALQNWVTAWMGEVTARIGIRPMIYTSPSFWKNKMGDTRKLADAGYNEKETS